MFSTISLLSVLALAAPEFDLLIIRGRIVDGTGAPWFRGDVGIQGDRIAAVGDLAQKTAARKIDAGDKIIAPGFIDMLGQSELFVLVDNRVESKIRQGITTEITGEGFSPGPVNDTLIAEMKPWLDKYKLKVDWTDLAGYFRRFEKTKSAINLGTFVGASTARAIVLGLKDEQPSPEKLQAMEKVVETAMKQGALGISSALIYPPGSYAKTPELIALAKIAAKHGGIYATHIRGEAETALAAIDEAVTIAREANIPVEIWHLKSAEKKNWGRMKEIIARIEKARADGLDITANMYPYTAAANGLSASIPEWAQAGGTDAMIARFRDPAQRARIKKELQEGPLIREGPESIMVVAVVAPELRPHVGRRLSEIAASMKKDPADVLMDLVETDRAMVGVVRFWMNEEDVRLGLKQPWVSIDCDAPGQALDGPFAEDKTHPRAFGSMARVLGHYARDEHLFTVEEAIRKMTSLPARRVRLFDRGVLRPGMAADVVVFDPQVIRDPATFEDPLQYAQGVEHVVVNGKVVLEAGQMTKERPGRILRRK